MQAAATATRSHALAPLKRGGPFERYFPTAGEFFIYNYVYGQFSKFSHNGGDRDGATAK